MKYIDCYNCPYNETWCEKVGGRKTWYGYCYDAYEDEEIKEKYVRIKEKHRKEDRRKRFKQKKKHKNKLKWQAKNITNYPSPSYGVGVNGKVEFDEDKVVYYKKVYQSKHADGFSYFKRYSNKRVRKCMELKNGSFYKKVFDYKWEIW